MKDMTSFQELFEIIKKYHKGRDYVYSTQVKILCSPDITRNSDGGKESYDIYSPELKKEARKLMLNGDAEDGGFFRFGTEAEGKWYQYEKGERNQPDKFTVSEISPEDKKRKEQEKRDREQVARDWEQAVRDRRQFEQAFKFRDKKCAECHQEIDLNKGYVGSKLDGQGERLHFCSENCSEKNSDKKQSKGENNSDNNSPGEGKCASCGKRLDPKASEKVSVIDNEGNRLYFCLNFLDCSESYFRNRHNQKQKDNLKCVECGDTPEGKDYWEWYGVDNELYCVMCVDKRPKKSEIEIEKTKLNSLKSKLSASSNPAEKERLEKDIKDTETHLKGLESKSKNNSNQSLDHPSKGYGKIILAGVAIFSVAILATILVMKTRKSRKARRKN